MDLTHFREFALFVKLLQVENLVIGEFDLRDERSMDVDAVDVGLVVSGFTREVLLERRFRIAKVDSGIHLKPLHLFLARHVFAPDVGAHFAEEFLLVVGNFEILHFPEADFVVFVGRLSVRVSKFVNPIVTSFATEDVGSVFDGVDVSGKGRRVVVVGGSSGH